MSTNLPYFWRKGFTESVGLKLPGWKEAGIILISLKGSWGRMAPQTPSREED